MLRSIAIGMTLTTLAAFASTASATPRHAHWHYMVGSRASFGKTVAKQLHFEAARPGDFSYELARVNAQDMERLGREIGEWTSAIRTESAPEDAAAIATQLETMRTEGELLAARGAELGTWIDERLARSAPASEDELRSRIAERARDLFYGFDRIMIAHKSAENTLGIPAPADPPPFDGS